MKKRTAAYGAAFLLFAGLFLIPSVRVKASAVIAKAVKSQATTWGLFGTAANGSTALDGGQGAYVTWNVSGSGFTDFVNNYGGGVGGYRWFNTSDTTVGTQLLQLDAAGGLQTTGNITAGTSGAGSVTATNFIGNVNGNLNGNANTASQFLSAPTQCGSGKAATGVAVNGNANCTSSAVLQGSQQGLVNITLCSSGLTSTDGNCTGTINSSNGMVAFADTNYAITDSVYNSGAAFLYLTITSKSNNAFNYILTCTFNCSVVTTPTADFILYHP